jgi:hypothetical protein
MLLYTLNEESCQMLLENKDSNERKKIVHFIEFTNTIEETFRFLIFLIPSMFENKILLTNMLHCELISYRCEDLHMLMINLDGKIT